MQFHIARSSSARTVLISFRMLPSTGCSTSLFDSSTPTTRIISSWFTFRDKMCTLKIQTFAFTMYVHLNLNDLFNELLIMIHVIVNFAPINRTPDVTPKATTGDCPPLDVNSVQFKNGVNALRDFLRIPPHQDYLEVSYKLNSLGIIWWPWPVQFKFSAIVSNITNPLLTCSPNCSCTISYLCNSTLYCPVPVSLTLAPF